jgi:SET domain-containing protein
VTAPRRLSPAPPVQASAARIIPPRTTKEKPAIYVRRIRGMGRGVFAGRRFRPGEVIEVCPVIPLPRSQTRACVGDLLDRYIFQWPRRGFPSAVVLGLGSLYNHAADPNARYTPRPDADVMVFRAARPIAAGEQILVDYEWPARDYHFPVAANGKR